MHKTLMAAALAVACLAGTASADTASASDTATGDAPAAIGTVATDATTAATTDAGAGTNASPEGAASSAPPAAPSLPTRTGLHLALTAGLTFGLTFGGDTLAEVTFTNGDTEKLKAGGLFYFAAGPSLEFANSPWSVQALIGRHLDSVTATNGELSFERNTLELQVFRRAGAHRFGLGYVKHLSPEYQESGAITTPLTVGFKDATGLSLEYNLLPVGSKVGFSVRAVKIDYETESANGMPVAPVSFSGNYFGAGLYVYL